MAFTHKNIRLHPTSYLGRFTYFVTLCCAGRRSVFASARNAVWLIDHLRKQSIAYRFAVHAYSVMPDHFHELLCGIDPTSNLTAFVKNFKQTTGYEYQEHSARSGKRNFTTIS